MAKICSGNKITRFKPLNLCKVVGVLFIFVWNYHNFGFAHEGLYDQLSTAYFRIHFNSVQNPLLHITHLVLDPLHSASVPGADAGG